MPPASAESVSIQAYRKAVRDEPLPGYVLIEPLGRGGFGEVWKCEAPGGLHKAIKFVAGANSSDSNSSNLFQQEFDAFLQIKTIRHPFLLTLERVELLDGDLLMVMELADKQMRDRFDECRNAGLPGIPREELLRYFSEAAEALDVINAEYGLQHLDVKPANLFITAGHVKVGDYGLVSRLDGKLEGDATRGLTPKYVAPEVLRGTIDPRSDQYSLALVYQEMLTGSFPYNGRTAGQMMLAHVTATPNLLPLPECDRTAVAKALSKNPEDRFSMCQDFVHALLEANYTPPAGAAKGSSRLSGSTAYRQRSVEATPSPGEQTSRHKGPNSGTVPVSHRTSSDSTQSQANQTMPSPSRSMPQLVSAGRWPSPGTPMPTPAPVAPPPVSRDDHLPLAEPAAPSRIRVNPIRSIVPVGRLNGETVPGAAIGVADFAAAVVATACVGAFLPQVPGDLGRLADGTWVCQFPSTVPETVAPFKLGVVRDHWSMTMEQPVEGRILFRKGASAGLWSALSGKKGGLEIAVQLPKAGRAIGEVTISGALFGTPDRTFLQAAQTALPKIIEDMRRELANVADRRKTPRIATQLPLTIHPLHSDGSLEPAVAGTCRDVSVGGICFSTAAPMATRYAYLEFSGVPAASGLAVLVKLLRSQPLTPISGHLYSGQFRADL